MYIPVHTSNETKKKSYAMLKFTVGCTDDKPTRKPKENAGLMNLVLVKTEIQIYIHVHVHIWFKKPYGVQENIISINLIEIHFFNKTNNVYTYICTYVHLYTNIYVCQLFESKA